MPLQMITKARRRHIACLMFCLALSGMAAAQPGSRAEPLATEPTLDATELADKIETFYVNALPDLMIKNRKSTELTRNKILSFIQIYKENRRRFRFVNAISDARWKKYSVHASRQLGLISSALWLEQCIWTKANVRGQETLDCQRDMIESAKILNLPARSVDDFINQVRALPDLEPITLGHVIGTVTIDIKARKEKRLPLAANVARLETNMAELQRAVARLEEEAATLEVDFDKVFTGQVARVKPFQERLLKASGHAPLDKAPQKLSKSAEISITRKERRIDQIDAALDHLNQQASANTTTAVRNQIAALTAERSGLQSGIEAMLNPDSESKDANSREKRLDEYKSAKHDYSRESRAMAQMVRTAHAPIDIKRDAIDLHRTRLSKARVQLDESKAQLALFDQQTASSFKSITTSHANIIFKSYPKAELDELDRLLREQEDQLQNVLRKKAAARKELVDLASALSDSAVAQSNDVILSWYVQTALQSVVQIAENARTSRGDRIGFIAGAISQMAVNLLSPPPLYTAKLKDGRIVADSGSDLDRILPRVMGTDLVTSSARQATEERSLAALGAITRATETALNLNDYAEYASLRKQIGTAVAGKRINRSVFKDQVIGAAVSAGTEKVKQYLAERMQESALLELLETQARMVDGIIRLQSLYELEDTDTNHLARLRAARDKITKNIESADRLSFQPALEYELNRVFDGDVGYSLTIDVESDPSVDPPKFRVLLDGQPLETGTFVGNYVFNKTHQQFFEQAERPFALPLTIQLD